MLKQLWIVFVIFLVCIMAIALSLKTEQSQDDLTRLGRSAKLKAKGPAPVCRYLKNKWSECDPKTSMRSRKLELKKGSSSCLSEKIETKKCKKVCRYNKGQWSECDSASNARTRIDSVKPDSPGSCQDRKLTKKCAKPCKYSPGEWTECKDNNRSRTRHLTAGDPNICQPTKTITKLCLNKKGQSRCFYDVWSEWSPCENGVQKKTRRVVAGEARCQDAKRTGKTRSCKSKA